MMSPLQKILKKEGVLKTHNIVAAFRDIDRGDFVLPEYIGATYEDIPLPIGEGQTISQPYTVAFMLELLSPKRGDKVLDVGSGSGWSTALLAHIVGKTGSVDGVEIVPELILLGRNNTRKYPHLNISIHNAVDTIGFPQRSPYDKILVSAAALSVPQELIDQLSIDGTLVIPIQTDIVRIKKLSEKKNEEERFEGFVFVPLVKKTSY